MFEQHLVSRRIGKISEFVFHLGFPEEYIGDAEIPQISVSVGISAWNKEDLPDADRGGIVFRIMDPFAGSDDDEIVTP